MSVQLLRANFQPKQFQLPMETAGHTVADEFFPIRFLHKLWQSSKRQVWIVCRVKVEDDAEGVGLYLALLVESTDEERASRLILRRQAKDPRVVIYVDNEAV